ncbi:hypothetical protein BJX99DRAFT_267213 [Aspergillus californicus]
MRPTSRDDFAVAIICALPLEADAIEAHFDATYDRLGLVYGKQHGDTNAYITGKIGKHNVVVCYLPTIGKASAASAAANLQTSYTEIKLTLLVGICGGVPSISGGRQIFLGDIIISEAVVEYDLGRQYPGGFHAKRSPPRALDRDIKSLLTVLESTKTRIELEELASMNLCRVQQLNARWQTPLLADDVLFEESYHHKHHASMGRVCSCMNGDDICDEALSIDCKNLGCGEARITRRHDRTGPVRIHFGPMGSADTVMKSGFHRNILASNEGIIGFEMEGAGVWNNLATCIVIKGVCDYADSHKDKKWQDYAAATGASAAKAFLRFYNPTKKAKKDYWMVPFPRNPDFAGRQLEIKRLEDLISLPDGPRTMAITGLGGIGKTQVALQLAYRFKDKDAGCSIFWVPCLSVESIEQGFSNITMSLGIQDVTTMEAKQYVKAHLSYKLTKWLIILDNVDIPDMWSVLKDILPKSQQGHILVTTRSQALAVKIASSHVVPISEPDEDTGMDILHNKLIKKELLNDRSTAVTLLERLTYLPLAIIQAASYMNENLNLRIADYLELLGEQESEALEMLSTDFTDENRYADIPNSVATTWLISFHQIQQLNEQAADLLRVMACVNYNDIPQAFLPPLSSKKEQLEALGVLSGFSFITAQQEKRSFNLHRLDNFTKYLGQAVDRLHDIFPNDDYENRQLWREYLPHAIAIIGEGDLEVGADYDDLPWKTAHCLWRDGRYKEAQEISIDIMERRLQQYGDKDASTLTWMAWVANTYGNQDQWERAKEIEARVLEKRRHELALDHDDTLRSIVSLAHVCTELGDWEEIPSLHRELLEAHWRKYKPGDPQMLDCLSSIAWSLSKFGLAGQEELGPDHPDTLTSMHKLACAYRPLWEYEKAKELLIQVLEGRKKKLGLEHPLVLESTVSMSGIYVDLKDWSKAETILVEAIDVYAAVLGPDHPYILDTMARLARVYKVQGRRQEADDLVSQMLESRKRVFGFEHADPLHSMGGLTTTHKRQNRQKEKASLEPWVKQHFLDLTHPNLQAFLEGGPHDMTTQSPIERLVTLQERRRLAGKTPKAAFFSPQTSMAVSSVAGHSGSEPGKSRLRERLIPKFIRDRARRP